MVNDESVNETRMVDFSVVIPVHNEAAMLACTLHPLYRLKPREVIFVLDRCTDSTERAINAFWKKYDFGEVKLVLLKVRKKSRWRLHLNFLYNLGIRKAKSKIVLLSQADILHDYVKIRKNIKEALNGMISFAVLEHPHSAPWNHFITKILQNFGDLFGVQPFSGVVAFGKEHYMTCPLKSSDSLNFDTQLHENFLRKGYLYTYVLSENFNIRPILVFKGGRSKLWSVGVDRYRLRKPFLKILLLSFVRFTPEIVAGYLHAKFGRT